MIIIMIIILIIWQYQSRFDITQDYPLRMLFYDGDFLGWSSFVSSKHRTKFGGLSNLNHGGITKTCRWNLEDFRGYFTKKFCGIFHYHPVSTWISGTSSFFQRIFCHSVGFHSHFFCHFHRLRMATTTMPPSMQCFQAVWNLMFVSCLSLRTIALLRFMRI